MMMIDSVDPRRYLISLLLILLLSTLSTARQLVHAEVFIQCRDGRMMNPSILTSADKAAELGCSRSYKNYWLHIKGTIGLKDARDFTIFVYLMDKNILPFPDSVKLNSSGGDLDSALTIASMFRMYGEIWIPGIYVMPNDICYSACVVILASGYQRITFGKVGLHRPYLTSKKARELGFTELKEYYDAMYVKLRKFFSEVNISPYILDTMWSISSGDLYVLSEDELQRTGLGKQDAIMTEHENIIYRNLCGPSGPSWKLDYFDRLVACIDRFKNSRSNVVDYCKNATELKNHPFAKCYVEAHSK